MNQDALVMVLLSERVKLLAYIRSLAGDLDLAEDLFQNVCVTALRKRASIRDEDHLKRWMRLVAKRAVFEAVRQRNRSVLFSNELIELLEPVWQRHDADDDATLGVLLRRCLRSLSEAHQDLVRRRFVDGVEYEQLAAAVGRPVASLYVTFSRIYAKLDKCITYQLGAGQSLTNR